MKYIGRTWYESEVQMAYLHKVDDDFIKQWDIEEVLDCLQVGGRIIIVWCSETIQNTMQT